MKFTEEDREMAAIICSACACRDFFALDTFGFGALLDFTWEARLLAAAAWEAMIRTGWTP